MSWVNRAVIPTTLYLRQQPETPTDNPCWATTRLASGRGIDATSQPTRSIVLIEPRQQLSPGRSGVVQAMLE